MEWKKLEDFPNYEFSETGLVRCDDKILSLFLSNGYPYVTLKNKNMTKRFKLHHIIAKLFLGEKPDSHIIRHLDDDRQNNCVSNLKYGTRSDNGHDAIANGKVKIGDAHYSRTNPERMSRGESHYSRLHPEKMARGERHGSKTHPESIPRGEKGGGAKLTQKEVDEIRATPTTYGCIKRLAEKYGVHRVTITKIRQNQTWIHINEVRCGECVENKSV